ncbi:isochorismatase family protein [Thermogymnomonas acidicola]|uniref:isochorismatase family protein n=1 Tax=Thermogymnomonas acidicola TaxID=399579 RepID=UPI001396A28A|nr:isochorismatase family protein [Thermogymnomonas acidicola]
MDAKRERALRGSAPPKSVLDRTFEDRFRYFLPDSKSTLVTVSGFDAFSSPALADAVRASGKRTVLLTGFTTELEVYVTSISALSRNYFSVVVSDATSTYSERVYYEALDLISRSVEVIDTRDLMKIWGE